MKMKTGIVQTTTSNFALMYVNFKLDPTTAVHIRLICSVEHLPYSYIN